MIVTLTLGAMILGLLWSALEQVMRLESTFSDERWRYERNALRIAWFQESVRGLLARPLDDEERFSGDARSFSGLTGEALAADGVERAKLTWALRYNSDKRETALVYTDLRGHEYPLLNWPGERGRIRYLRPDRALEDRWPPLKFDTMPQLPVAIVLETGVPGLETVVAATVVDEFFLPRRIDIEKM